MWYLKKFEELTNLELQKIYKERVKVFVVEQHCFYQEVDDNDLIALHLFSTEKDDIVAYARIIPGDIVSIGRILVNNKYRKKKLGKVLVEKALEVSKEHFPNKEIHISAQAYLKDFYSSIGFEKLEKDYYLEDGIPHYNMIYKKRG
ncbi:MAG: GNAT family N-acetyltransferase [Peptoniphilaceae bacterium]